jgi:hypothetical protein
MAGSADQTPVELAFPDSVRRTMGRAVGEALHGFDNLALSGFWLNRPQALDLIKSLFRLRQVGHLLPLLPESVLDRMSLTEA